LRGEEQGRWSFWNREFVKDLSTIRGVKGSMAMGTVLAVELEDAEGGESSWHLVRTQHRPIVLHTPFAPIRSAALLREADTFRVTDNG
jgi:hypothetical protein